MNCPFLAEGLYRITVKSKGMSAFTYLVEIFFGEDGFGFHITFYHVLRKIEFCDLTRSLSSCFTVEIPFLVRAPVIG